MKLFTIIESIIAIMMIIIITIIIINDFLVEEDRAIELVPMKVELGIEICFVGLV
jgi:hypothetical protein